MLSREKLQEAYELAFFPPRLNKTWHQIKAGDIEDIGRLNELLDTALLLHQALPDSGYASQRALKRLAVYQANARAFGMAVFLRRLRKKLGLKPLQQSKVPGRLVRDIGLPRFSHG